MKVVQKIRFMRHVLTLALGAFFIVGTVSFSQAQTTEKTAGHALKQGDRVAFFGDSITAQDLYTTFVANHYMAFRPELKLTFKNAGVGGDALSNGISRIDRDLVPFKPTVITCFFGMNDAGYVAPDDPKVAENLAKYKEDYAKLLGLLREKCPNARIVLFTTSVVDSKQNNKLSKYNEVLEKFSAFVREFGKEQKLQVVELYKPMLEWVEKTQGDEHPYSIIPDSVHPNATGQFLMAELILKAWGER